MEVVKDYKYLRSLIFHGEGNISLDFDISLKKSIDIKKDNLTIGGNYKRLKCLEFK